MALGQIFLDTVDDLCQGDPTCVVDPGVDQGMGIADWFIAVFVIVVLLAIAAAVYRVQAARSLARSAGMDEDAAARVTMMSDDGLEATYLASQLRSTPTTSAAQPPRSTRERLTELQRLHEEGLVTDEEFAARRRAIIEQL